MLHSYPYPELKKMKGKLLAWFLLMIQSSLAITNSSFRLEHHLDDVNVSMLQGQEIIHGEHTVEIVRLTEVNEPEEHYGRGSNNNEGDLVVLVKGQKGNGGANAASRPRQEKSKATFRPSLFVKIMLNVISFSLVLILSFKVL